jgi:hypothetical protein
MGDFDFPVRFIADEHYIRDILKDKDKAKDILLLLNHIHKNSKTYPMCHNLMTDESFKNSISDKEIRGMALLGAFHPEPWTLASEISPESSIMKYAINAASKKPGKVILLTSASKLESYKNDSHYSNGVVKSAIRIAAGDEAYKLIHLAANLNRCS